MTITDKQRKFLWIAGGVLAVIYLGPSLINHVRKAFMETRASATSAKPSPAHPSQPPAVFSPLPVTPAVDADVARLAGTFNGHSVFADRGLCQLAVQIKPNAEMPGTFTGYSTMSCFPYTSVSGHTQSRMDRGDGVANSLTPTSTIMTGTPANGGIAFKVDKAIGTPIWGCPIASMQVTPFAGGQIAVEWTESGSCKGNKQLILTRK